MPHPVIHFEIEGKDGAALQKFYADVFGWKVDANNEMNYGIVSAENEGGGIGGGISASQDGTAAVRVYIEAADLEAALDKAEKAGAKTLMTPMDVPGGPTIAMFQDPAGNQIGLVKA